MADVRSQAAALATAVEEAGAELAAKREAAGEMQREAARAGLAAAALRRQLAEAEAGRAEAEGRAEGLTEQVVEAEDRGSALQVGVRENRDKPCKALQVGILCEAQGSQGVTETLVGGKSGVGRWVSVRTSCRAVSICGSVVWANSVVIGHGAVAVCLPMVVKRSVR